MLESSRNDRLDRWDALISVTLVAFVILLFWIFLERPRLSDQITYFHNAWQISDAKPTHWALRIGLVLPIWLVTRVFSYSELSYYAIPAVSALLLALST